MKTLVKFFMALCLSATVSTVADAKNYELLVQTEPDGAEVILNGVTVAESTPAVLTLDQKVLTKTMIFKFVKEGYVSKSLPVSYTKKELKLNPKVYCKLKRDPKAVAAEQQRALQQTSASEKTHTVAQDRERVSRNNAGSTTMEQTILRWFFDSDPRGARIYWRVISSVPAEVKNTNETYLMTTPYEETRSFGIEGLTYDNSRNVTVEIKVSKRGYEDQVKRFNVRQALDQQEISGFFELVEKERPQRRSDSSEREDGDE